MIDSMTWRSGLKNRAPARVGFTLAGGAKQLDLRVGQVGLEVAAEVVLVADQDLARTQRGHAGVGQDLLQGLAFVGLRAGQREPDR